MKKFIIACPSRTGATVLVDALAQHPQVVALGELFMPDAQERRRQCSIAGRAYQDGEEGGQFLREWAFIEHERAVIGFKLMYYDGQTDPLVASARRYLIETED